MRSRSQELRARHRRVLLASYVVAALILGAVFIWSPTFQVEPLRSTDAEVVSGEEASPATSALFLHVRFGPPTILDADGSPQEEPEHRVLEVGRVVEVPTTCKEELLMGTIPSTGQVRLRVGGSGAATLVQVTESMGTACFDELMEIVAGALRYEWLPDDRFPPPVEVLQAVSLLDVAEVL